MRFYRVSNKMYFSYAFVFFLFLSWGLPALACTCRSRVASTKANMHTLQTALETYAIQHRGVYPKNLKVLQKEAQAQNYWKDFSNPYSNQGKLIYLLPFGEMADWEKVANDKLKTVKYLLGLRVRVEEHPDIQRKQEMQIGRVLYAYQSPNHYKIYGVGDNGKLLRDREHLFCLSND